MVSVTCCLVQLERASRPLRPGGAQALPSSHLRLRHLFHHQEVPRPCGTAKLLRSRHLKATLILIAAVYVVVSVAVVVDVVAVVVGVVFDVAVAVAVAIAVAIAVAVVGC